MLTKKIEGAKRLRAERRRQQEANVARKRKEKELHRQQCMKGVAKREGSDGVEGEESEDDDDVAWYRQEVGQEPDPGGNNGCLTSISVTLYYCTYLLPDFIVHISLYRYLRFLWWWQNETSWFKMPQTDPS